MAIAALKTWVKEKLKYTDLNNEFTHYRNHIKNNKDLILGDSVEGTGYAGHDHEGVNGVQLGTDALENLAVTAAKIANGTITLEKFTSGLAQIFAGGEQRAQFIWDDYQVIKINGARYLHLGTTNQVVYWKTQLTLNFADLGNNTWYYIYLDDSAIVIAQNDELTANELTYSDVAPTWSNIKCGWYSADGLDRCIFAVLTDNDETGRIVQFYQSGDLVMYRTEFSDIHIYTEGGVAGDWTLNLALTIPSFSIKALITAYGICGAAASNLYWKVDDGISYEYHRPVEGHLLLHFQNEGVFSDNAHAVNSITVITNDTQKIALASEPFTVIEATITTNGWYLPVGI